MFCRTARIILERWRYVGDISRKINLEEINGGIPERAPNRFPGEIS